MSAANLGHLTKFEGEDLITKGVGGAILSENVVSFYQLP
jgi:hypothetical protein